jgi:hypothetical protein
MFDAVLTGIVGASAGWLISWLFGVPLGIMLAGGYCIGMVSGGLWSALQEPRPPTKRRSF